MRPLAPPPPIRARHDAARPPAAGFTLMEAALATIIIAVGVLAVAQANQAFIRHNAWSSHASTAMFLGSELREMMRALPRHDRFTGGVYFENPDAHSGFRGWGPEPDEPGATAFDDLDDFDGALFGAATSAPGDIVNTFPGPLNASGGVVREINWQGESVVDDEGEATPLVGWSQYVEVVKVDPADFRTVLDDDYYAPAAGGAPERPVDAFPLRVTVYVLHQAPGDDEPTEAARISWIAPAAQ